MTNNRFDELTQRIKPVIPVIKVLEEDHAEPLAEALLAGGIQTAEITLRSPAALPAIARMRRHRPELIVGAGTVLSSQQYQSALDAGSEFIISPGLTLGLLETARQQPTPFIPGVLTPSEMLLAMEYGLTRLKLFPANAMDTFNYLKSLAGPFHTLSFCPTGGLKGDDTATALELSNVFAAGGTWITPNKSMIEQDWASIEALARQAAALEHPI